METNNPAQLFEQNRDRTRVLITGSENGIAELIIHSLKFCGKPADFILESELSEIGNEDFLILEYHKIDEAGDFHPNVVLIASENTSEDFSPLLNNIVGGGILIYNESDENLANAVHSTENYFRKLPYTKPDFDGNKIKTEIGDIPFSATDLKLIPHIEGAKLLCQQLGIMEEEFYESLMSF